MNQTLLMMRRAAWFTLGALPCLFFESRAVVAFGVGIVAGAWVYYQFIERKPGSGRA